MMKPIRHNRSTSYLIIVIVLGLMIGALGFHASVLAAAQKDLPPAAKKILKHSRDQTRFTSLRADIRQTITEVGKGRQVYAGKYMADNRGRFRVDFFEPEPQTVLFDSRELYWVFYRDKLIWRIQGDDQNGFWRGPVAGQVEKISREPKLKYLGETIREWGRTHVFQIPPGQAGEPLLEIIFEDKRAVPLIRRFLNNVGEPVFEERFSDYQKISGVWLPGRVLVRLRRNGRQVLENSARYSNARVNQKIPEYYFQLNKPAGFQVRDWRAPGAR